jgi:octaprenyl-diphosphate synthase
VAICRGEIEQSFIRFQTEIDATPYLAIIQDKTAALYGAACSLGARYSGGTEREIATLRAFGTNIGMAFQIIDDCLDLTGNETVVGKSLGTDLKLGKITLPLIHLLGNTPTQSRSRLLALLHRAERTDTVPELRSEFDVDGAITYSLSRAGTWVRSAMTALETLPTGPARDAMAALAEYVVRRSF